MPDNRILPTVEDPAEAAVAKETVRLAFMAALQQLPPKQRAVLILREVLAWKASEVAELLDTSVASVNSALQRARATLAEREEQGADAAVSDPLDEEQQRLLDRYVKAFEGYDMTALTALLHEDAIMTMPPFDLWLTGHDDITGFMTTLGSACEGSRLVPVQVNGLPGFAQYKPDPEKGGHTLGGTGAGDLRRPAHRVPLLPRHPALVPPVRTAPPPRSGGRRGQGGRVARGRGRAA